MTAIFVNEKPPDLLRQDSFARVNNMLLRVPSGRLIATGCEDFTALNGSDSASMTFHPEMGEPVEIEPGFYSVDGWQLDPDALTKKHEAEGGPDLTGIPERTIKFHQWVSEWIGLGCFVTLPAMIYLIVLVNLGLLLSFWSLPALIPCFYWLVVLYVFPRTLPGWEELGRRNFDYQKKIEVRYPSIVLHMRKLPEPMVKSVDMVPGVFGVGAAEQ